MASVTPIEIIVYSLSANGVLDDASPMYAYVKVPSIITSITDCAVSLAFRQFSSNAKTAASGGAVTSGNTSLTSYTSNTTHSHTDPQGGNTGETAPGTFVTSIDSAHTHTGGLHTHSLTYGTYEETYPASHSVWLKVYKLVGSTWTLQGTTANQTANLANLDLTSLITGPGDYQLRIQSNTGQPNSGRLGCDLYGAITAQIG